MKMIVTETFIVDIPQTDDFQEAIMDMILKKRRNNE